MTLGQIGCVRGDLIGDHAVLDVLAVGQAEVFLRRDVAQHRGAGLRDHRRADRRRDVVVRGRDVGGQRPERIEGRLLAQLLFQPHILDDLVHRDVARALDHHLHAMGFRDLRQLAERAQLRELRGVVGVGDRAGPQPVAEGERDVVAGQDLAQFLEVGVKERLLVMREAPGRHDRAAAADDAGDPVDRQRDVAQQHPGVHGHVVHALLALLNHGVAVQPPRSARRDRP